MVVQQLIARRRGAATRGGGNGGRGFMPGLFQVKIVLLGALGLFVVTFIALDDTTTPSTSLLMSTLEKHQQAIYNIGNTNDAAVPEGVGANSEEIATQQQQQQHQEQPYEAFTQLFVDAQQQHRQITALIPNGDDDEPPNNSNDNNNVATTARAAVTTESDYHKQVRDETRARAREGRIRHHHHHHHQEERKTARRHSVVISDGIVQTVSADNDSGRTNRHIQHHQRHHQKSVENQRVNKEVHHHQLDGFITRHDSVAGDPLRDPNWNASAAKPLPFSPKTEYLGVLVDAGRHYFPILWLYNLIDRLADMKYNLIHFRLTDDQSWNVLLEHTPSLASPSHVDNPDLRVYTVPELRALVAYAKERGISFMPEINVPGHGGAWAAALNGTAIVACPNFICEKGYGVPLNVTNPAIFVLLESILREIIDIFEDPPFLHLGGDEVNMAAPCFQEVGQTMPNFQDFEDRLRKLVVHKLGYPEERIVRWEMTGQAALRRVGAMEQFWFSVPGESRSKYAPGSRFMLSTHMYFDTNGEEDCSDVYRKAERGFHLEQTVSRPTAIVAATFELSPAFWFDRNVLGRLLSVAMGAAQIHIQENITESSYEEMKTGLNAKYEEYCNILGLGPSICQTQGRPVIPTMVYQAKWRQGWEVWKKAICHRLTDAIDTRVFRTARQQTITTRTAALDYFADNFASLPDNVDADEDRAILADGLLPESWASLGRHDKQKGPEFAGVVLDLTTTLPSVAELKMILEEFVAKLGLNTVQLRLAGKHGWTFQNSIQQAVYYRSIQYTAKNLQEIDRKASKLGLQVIPEISVSSDANGFHATGLVANCPIRFCQEGIPFDISNKIIPFTVFSQVATLRKSFPTSRFFHLGSDERQASLACFEEAAATAPRTTPVAALNLSDFDAYEHRLSKMLQLGGDIEPGHVLRWENAERKRYLQRTGNITHYRSGTALSSIRLDDGPFFVTVNLLEKKVDGSMVSAWDIYELARALVDTKPMGIMAEIGTISFESWEDWEIPQRILAFSMAVSDLPILESESSFATTFMQICQATLDLEQCAPPAARGSDSTNALNDDEQLLAATQCQAATMIQQRQIMKLGTPHYNDTGKQLLLDQPSKAIWSLS